MTRRGPAHGDASALTRRQMLALSGASLALGVTGCSAGSPEAVPSPATPRGKPARRRARKPEAGFTLDFDGQALGRSEVTAVGASISPKYGRDGRRGCRLEPTAATGNCAALVLKEGAFPAGRPWAKFRMTFRLVTLPGQSQTYMNLFEIGNTATVAPKSQFTVYFRRGRLVCDFNSSERFDIAAVPERGTWHTIEAIVGYGGTSYTAQVTLDGEPSGDFTSRNNKQAESVRAVWIHYPTVPVDYTMDVDEVRIETSTKRSMRQPE